MNNEIIIDLANGGIMEQLRKMPETGFKKKMTAGDLIDHLKMIPRDCEAHMDPEESCLWFEWYEKDKHRVMVVQRKRKEEQG